MTVRKLGGGVMALYDVTARLNLDSLIYLDESDFENEEDTCEEFVRIEEQNRQKK